MASEVEIANAALQKLGVNRIVDLSDDSVNARACNACYERLRDAELRKHNWNFAKAREALAADADTPEWGRANQFTLPSDFLKMQPPYPEYNWDKRDWIVEGGKILTNDSAPLYLRYIARVTDPNVMDPLFREALSCAMAVEMAEELTQSNTKKDVARQSYTAIIREAKRANAIDNVPIETTDGSWITCRA